jgi:hypothetical protein
LQNIAIGLKARGLEVKQGNGNFTNILFQILLIFFVNVYSCFSQKGTITFVDNTFFAMTKTTSRFFLISGVFLNAGVFISDHFLHRTFWILETRREWCSPGDRLIALAVSRVYP